MTLGYHIRHRLSNSASRTGQVQHQIQRIQRGRIVARYQYTDTSFRWRHLLRFIDRTLLP